MELNFEEDPQWWNGRIPDNLILNEIHPDELKKWQRKRLQPLLPKLLFPASWSLLILTIGIIFTLFDYRTNFSEYIGSFIIILGPCSLGLSILYLSNIHQNSNIIRVLFQGLLGRTRILWALIILILFTISIIQKPTNPHFWNLMILPTTILWIEFLAFGCFYFSSPFAIWMTEIDFENDLPISKLESKGWIWMSDSLKPVNSLIAIKKDSKGNSLELSSIKSNKQIWIVLSWWQKSGIRHDPFVNKNVKGVAIPWLTKKLGYSTILFDCKMLDGLENLDPFIKKS